MFLIHGQNIDTFHIFSIVNSIYYGRRMSVGAVEMKPLFCIDKSKIPFIIEVF